MPCDSSNGSHASPYLITMAATALVAEKPSYLHRPTYGNHISVRLL